MLNRSNEYRILDHHLIKLPLYAGNYVILDGLIFPFCKTPNWFHRVMTRLLLGWVWHDTIKAKEDSK